MPPKVAPSHVQNHQICFQKENDANRNMFRAAIVKTTSFGFAYVTIFVCLKEFRPTLQGTLIRLHGNSPNLDPGVSNLADLGHRWALTNLSDALTTHPFSNSEKPSNVISSFGHQNSRLQALVLVPENRQEQQAQQRLAGDHHQQLRLQARGLPSIETE